MDTPGYDPVAATGQVAGGANLVCFTTGRGSVFGCKPAPSIKLATNTPMYKRMEDDMDVNCGTILDGEETVQQCGQRIFELMLKTASGQPTKSESFDFGGAEFAPWVLGRDDVESVVPVDRLAIASHDATAHVVARSKSAIVPVDRSRGMGRLRFAGTTTESALPIGTPCPLLVLDPTRNQCSA